MSEGISSATKRLKPSLEEQYIEGMPGTASDIYMELALLAVSKANAIIFWQQSDLMELTTPEELTEACKAADRALAYRIGSRAAYADFGSGTTQELRRLADATNI